MGLGTDASTLTKVGSGTLTLMPLSSRTGPVAISGGTLQVGADGGVGYGRHYGERSQRRGPWT